MSYVIAAWASCGALLVLYALRTWRREGALRRLMGDGPPRRRALAGPGTADRAAPTGSEVPWR